jgi:hypothetical protein
MEHLTIQNLVLKGYSIWIDKKKSEPEGIPRVYTIIQILEHPLA